MTKIIETQDMAKIIIAGRISSAMPDLEAEVDTMQKTAKNKAFQHIRAGTLTGDEAINLWHEMHSYDRLLQRLRSRVNMGASIADANEAALNPNKGE